MSLGVIYLLVVLAFSGSLGLNQYVSYMPGDYPLIISAPHGGFMKPSSIPDRHNGCFEDSECVYNHQCETQSNQCPANTLKDTYTREIAVALRDQVKSLTGEQPHLIINNLHRLKMDANRERNLATFGVPAAVDAYDNYTMYIEDARTRIGSLGHGRGLFVDIHGHTHKENWVELGYLLRGSLLVDALSNAVTSIHSLQDRNCDKTDTACRWDFINGERSLGNFLDASGVHVRVVPSPETTDPQGGNYFSGGYTTKIYSSMSGRIDVIQIGIPSSIRFAERDAFSVQLANAVVNFMNEHEY